MRKRWSMFLLGIAVVGAVIAVFATMHSWQSAQLSLQNKATTTTVAPTAMTTRSSAGEIEAKDLSNALNNPDIQAQSEVMTPDFVSAYLAAGKNMHDSITWEIDSQSLDAGDYAATINATAVSNDGTRTKYVFFLQRTDVAQSWLISSMQKE